ncbi:STAS/SEC14 domain-containing protein [Arthrobacter sp. ISL-72]|uniref:DUF7793 family protein n=1 Tax=Arthrobacter sp. ISL-72 TaxID=2819114 RepID=UPI001BE96B67|nr:STAS/SEC14 domain-containing protein [Arthrobacter sp. ISL-72]MBT2597020.1 STAS/SEC14 domain-containing protein [Arthrobacter sp. ISL-72]
MQEQIVRIVLPRDQHLDERSAQRLAAHLQAPRSGSPIAVLMDVTDVASVSRAARTVFSNVSTVAAWALLGRTPVDRILAHFILGGDFKSGPASYFTSEPEAVEWLKENAHVH